MAHYAYLDENSIVTLVIVGRNEGEDGVNWEDYYGAKRCSYNTHGGVHSGGGTPYRYNMAAVGYTFSDAPQWAAQGGAFIPPQPFPSWILNPATACWNAPVAMPVEGGPYYWDEGTLSWAA